MPQCWYVQFLAVVCAASTLDSLRSSALSPRAAFAGQLLRFTGRHPASLRRAGRGMMAVDSPRRVSTAKHSLVFPPMKPIIQKRARPRAKTTSQAVGTLTLDTGNDNALFKNSMGSLQVDQPLLLATAFTATALAIAWFGGTGGEYWTAASRAAFVAMLRTMSADYVTQLGKHKFGHEDGEAGHGKKLSLLDEFEPDLNRTCSMGMFYALYYMGPFSYVLTELYPRWFGNDGSWQEVWTKVLVENLLWMPIGYWMLWSLFKVGIDCYLEAGQKGAAAAGDTSNSFDHLARAVWRDITTDFRKKNLASLSFWGPCDIFNFKFVPQYDVPTAMVVEGAMWAAILGTIEYDQKNKTTADA